MLDTLDRLFDTFAGLPLHPLVVHAVVVLLPLMSLVTIAVAVRRDWRRFGGIVLVLDILVFLASGAAWFSGRALYFRFGQLGSNPAVAHHVSFGNYLPLFALGLVVAAAVVALASRRAALVPVAIVLAVVAGLAATGWTVLTGDAGARANWADIVKNTKGP